MCQFHRFVVVFSGCLAWLRAAGQWVLLQGGRELLVLGSLLSSCSAGMQGGEASPFLTFGYQECYQGQRAAGAGAHSLPLSRQSGEGFLPVHPTCPFLGFYRFLSFTFSSFHSLAAQNFKMQLLPELARSYFDS